MPPAVAPVGSIRPEARHHSSHKVQDPCSIKCRGIFAANTRLVFNTSNGSHFPDFHPLARKVWPATGSLDPKSLADILDEPARIGHNYIPTPEIPSHTMASIHLLKDSIISLMSLLILFDI